MWALKIRRLLIVNNKVLWKTTNEMQILNN